jgi:hypothetical protein
MIVFGREAAGLPPEPPIPVTPVPPMSVDQALHLLWTNRNAVRGVGRPAGRTARIRSLEEMRPQILRKFNTWIAARRWLDGRRAEPARQGNVAPESKQTDAGAGDSPAAVAVSRSRA